MRRGRARNSPTGPAATGLVPDSIPLIGPASVPGTNLLLARLSPHEYTRLQPHLQPVTFKALDTLTEMGGPVEYVYFPVSAVISVVRPAGDGTYVETATVGREGMAGVSTFFGTSWAHARLEVQVPGECLRIPSEIFRGALSDLPSLRSFIGKFVLSFIDQISQSVVCSSRHSLARRCARWLLMAHDRVTADSFTITHVTLARMLDARRSGVTEAALSLKQRGLIAYSRGRITVLDRPGLEAAACDCYAINRAHLDSLYTTLTTP